MKTTTGIQKSTGQGLYFTKKSEKKENSKKESKTMLKVGVIGLGTVSPIHLHSINQSPHARLAAVCDIDTDLAQKKCDATHCDITPIYSDYKEMIDKQQLTYFVLFLELAFLCLRIAQLVLLNMILCFQEILRQVALLNQIFRSLELL